MFFYEYHSAGMKGIILGRNGFVGKNLLLHFEKQGWQGLARPAFDICHPSTFSSLKLNEEDNLIVDCICKTEEPFVRETNVEGLKNILAYLNREQKPYTYVYFSTYSVLYRDKYPDNVYVQSKYEAEEIVRNECKNFKIARLIHPFGAGENPNRLISRLLGKVFRQEIIQLDRLHLNLTPADCLPEALEKIIQSHRTEINLSTHHIYYLPEIVDFMGKILNKKPMYQLSEKILTVAADSDVEIDIPEEKVWQEIEKMANLMQ
jgi:nucleoside-diphosphate-sugar epimerase